MTESTSNLALANHGGVVRRMLVNTASLLTADIVNRAAVFAVYIMVGRMCGARSFGQLSLGLTLLYTFQVLASAGLPTLITREIAKRPTLAGRYLANAGLIVLGAFLLSLGALALLVVVSRYPADTSKVILLLALGILPWALTSITESLLRAWERMHYLLLVHGPINLLKVGLVYYLLSSGYDVPAVAVVFLVCQTATLLFELPVVLRHVDLNDMALSVSFCKDILKRAWRFIGIDSLVAIWGSINTVLLSWFASEAAVGVFAAAWQLLMPVRLTNQSVANSLFPMLCRRAEESRTRFQQFAVLQMDLLIFFTVPSMILLFFSAGLIINFVYGAQDFADSIIVLRILLPVLVLQAITAGLGQVLYSHRREHRTLLVVAASVGFNIISSVVLIHAYGVRGAAVSDVLTGLLNVYLHYLVARDCLRNDAGEPIRLKSTLIGSILVAGGVMAAALAMLMKFGFPVAGVVASLLYLATFGGLVYATCGNFQLLSERYLAPLRENGGMSVVVPPTQRDDSLCPEAIAT